MSEKGQDPKLLGYTTYQSFVDRFVKELAVRFATDVFACALFGSVARGEARAESDVDLFVLFSEMGAEEKEKLLHLLIEADQWREKKSLLQRGILSEISVISRTEAEISDNPLLLLDILDHGIILHDQDERLGQLLQRFQMRLTELGARKIAFDDGSWAWDLKPDWKPGEVVEVKL